MRAKDYLNQISKIDRLIENKIAEMEYWKAIATGTTAYSEGDRVQSTGSKEKMPWQGILTWKAKSTLALTD